MYICKNIHILSSHISVFHATGCFMWALVPKSSGIEYMVQYNQMATQFPYQKEKRGKKTRSIFSCFPQQLARPVPAAVVDLVPLVEGGSCWGEHYQVLLLQT